MVLGIINKASANAWIPKRLLPLISSLYFCSSCQANISKAPAPGTIAPAILKNTNLNVVNNEINFHNYHHQ